jgi:CHAD domain-containing protein
MKPCELRSNLRPDREMPIRTATHPLKMIPSNISLQRHETLRSGLLRVINLLTDSVTDNPSNHSSNGEQDIHEVRTTIKRLRALLRLIRPAIDPKFFNRENARLRGAAGLLSFARDTEVARETLKTLPVSNQTEQEAVSSVLSSLESRGDVANDPEQAMAEVRRRLEQTRRNFHRLELAGTEREILESGLGAVYRQGRKRMNIAIRRGQDVGFHRWRIRAKNLYYELQFLELMWTKRLHRLISHLSELQDNIGLDHDAAVLRAWLKKSPESFGGDGAVQRVVTCLDSRTRELREKAVPLGRKIWRDKPGRFAREVVRHWHKR